MKQYTAIITFAVASALGGTAFNGALANENSATVASGDSRIAEHFASKDTNGDGKVDFDEWWEAEWQTYLSHDDADKDGLISENEYLESMCAGQRGHLFQDGRSRYESCVKIQSKKFKFPITKNSIKNQSRVYFKVNDKNRDGVVTLQEMSQSKR